MAYDNISKDYNLHVSRKGIILTKDNRTKPNWNGTKKLVFFVEVVLLTICCVELAVGASSPSPSAWNCFDTHSSQKFPTEARTATGLEPHPMLRHASDQLPCAIDLISVRHPSGAYLFSPRSAIVACVLFV